MIKEKNVMTSYVTDDYISFKTECDCYSHDLRVTFEKNEFGIMLEFNDKIYIQENDKNIFTKIYSRIKYMLQILFKGYVEIDYEFIFKGEKHVEEFMHYMNESYKKINAVK